MLGDMIGNYVDDGLGTEGQYMRRGELHASRELERYMRMWLAGNRDPWRVLAHIRHWSAWVFYYRTGLNRPPG